ncbi:MAG: hypothetical protein M1826_001785 [Phylliscum demangeonii]|nr:MAG: hypothetical protein M1826_001785 [Phylliscum demangeonii]
MTIAVLKVRTIEPIRLGAAIFQSAPIGGSVSNALIVRPADPPNCTRLASAEQHRALERWSAHPVVPVHQGSGAVDGRISWSRLPPFSTYENTVAEMEQSHQGLYLCPAVCMRDLVPRRLVLSMHPQIALDGQPPPTKSVEYATSATAPPGGQRILPAR